MSRRIDLSKFRGDSDSDDDSSSFDPLKKAPQQPQLDYLKQQTFSHGTYKKTKKDIERENEERKRKEEEIAAAKAFAEFEAEFAGDGDGRRGSSYSRYDGGSSRGGSRAGGFVKASGDISNPGVAYQPSRPIPTGPSASSRSRPREPSPEEQKSKPKGARAMDSFLEEIKKEQQYREQKFGQVAKQEGTSVSALAAWERQRGSHDIGDSETTNVFISNLPNGINEESLGMFFAKYGPVGAVKIMWPRGEDDLSFGPSNNLGRRSKSGLSGFVAFMKRKDAEIAVKELDGLDWGGSIIRVGWSKMVKIPLRPIFDLTTRSEGRDRSRSPHARRRSSPHERSQIPHCNEESSHDHKSKRPRSDSYDSCSSDSSASTQGDRPPLNRSRHEMLMEKLVSKIGSEKEKFVRACADRVQQHGKGFEEMLRDREAKNEKFAFLRDVDLPEYQLYRSITDRHYRLPSPPPDGFVDDGKAELYSSDSAEDSDNERTKKGSLGKLARRRFENGLRGVRGEREEIARLMEFAVVHADAVDEVADIICQSLKIGTTPIPRKIARLHLVSDILHNSASPLPNVWRYRQAFESRLRDVMEHFAEVHRALVAQAGRLSAESFKSQVLFVLGVWENWLVVTPNVMEQFRAILDGSRTDQEPSGSSSTLAQVAARDRSETTAAQAESKFKKAASGGFKSIAFKDVQSTTPIAAQDSGVKAPTVNEDLDGEVMGEDDDLDGEEMDLDGEEMDLDVEDLDGEAIA